MKKLIIAYFKIRNAYRYFRKNWNPERIWGVYIVLIAIPGAIVIDVWWQSHVEPLKYIASTVHAEEVKRPVRIEVVIDWTEERINKEIEDRAKEYGVSAEVMKTVIWCESRYNKDALGDGGKSRGLSQIHSHYHPQVLDKQAYDPAFAIRFLAEKLSKGQGYLWSCWNQNYGT